MSAKETVVPYGDDAAPYDNDDLSAFADQVRHDYGWCFDSDRAQAARWLATVDALRAERDEARANAGLMEMKLVACGVAAHHSDPNLTRTGVYAGKWDSQQAEDVRRLRAERDRLKALLGEARPMVYIKANEFSEHEDVTLERQSVLARIDKEIAS